MGENTKNGVKNGEGTQFNSNNQPSSEAKSRGWERRRQAQVFMDKVMEYQNLTIEEFENIETDVHISKQKYTVRDWIALNYVSNMVRSYKLVSDWLDRHLGKAPTLKPQVELSDDKIDKVVVEIVNNKQEIPKPS